MKKLLSVFMSIMLITLSLADGFNVLALEDNGASHLDAFAEKLVSMIRKNDNINEAEDDIPNNDFDVDFPIDYFNTNNYGISNNNTLTNSYSSTKFGQGPQYKYGLNFSSGRLIVKSKHKIDLQGAKEYISGYKDLYILQYDTYVNAQKAYDYYKTLDTIEYVEPDITRRMQEDDIGMPGMDPEIVEDVKSDAISWVSEQIGFEDIKEELAGRIKRDVKVAVLDSGVDTDHEFLEGRLLPNNVNLSSSGEQNSCEDDYGHGTHVAGILVDNTLENVKIKPYKVLNNMGNGSTSLISIAIDMAVADGADIINLSLSAEGENQMLRDSIDEATEQGVNVIVAAGNNGADLTNKVISPACVESAVTVSAVDKNQKLSSYSNYNGTVDIAAPGDNVMSSYLNNTYSLLSGTSMATPQVSAGFAIVRSVYPEKTGAEVEEMIKKYAIKIQENVGENKYGSGILYLKYILQSIPRTAKVVFSVAEGTFNQPFKLTLTCPEENATILYAINLGKDVELGYLNGKKYDTPINISETSKVTAIAVTKGKLFSTPVTYTYERFFATEDDKYEVSSSGYITDYFGTETDITIPEKIRGITIKGIGSNAFKNDKTVRSVSLPDTATRIFSNAFYGCSNLETVTGNGITQVDASAFQMSTLENFPFNQLTKIGSYAFSGCNNLKNIDLSNVETIESYAFENTQGIGELNGEKLKTIGKFAFRNSDITKASLPNVLLLNESVFAECSSLEEVTAESVVNVSKAAFKDCISLKSVNISSATALGNDVFYNSSIKFIDLPQATKLGNNVFSGCEQLKTISLPLTEKVGTNAFRDCKALKFLYLPMLKSIDYSIFSGCEQLKSLWLPGVKTVASNAFQNSSVLNLQFDSVEKINGLPDTLLGLVLPSTIKAINATAPDTDFIVYGNAGTYAEEYANTVGKEFREVPCVVFEMPEQVNVEDKYIFAYALGYNCTYQWYENDKVSNEGGTPIEGATKFYYEPNREDGATAYYCVITSDDGINQNTFVTNSIENAFEYREADYSEYERVMATVDNLDRELYTQESLKLLDDIVSVDISGYSLAEQNRIYEHISAIEKALSLLEPAYELADINDDGTITLVDARMALQAVSETVTLTKLQTLAADVNGDGKITLVDARMILQVVAGALEL